MEGAKIGKKTGRNQSMQDIGSWVGSFRKLPGSSFNSQESKVCYRSPNPSLNPYSQRYLIFLPHAILLLTKITGTSDQGRVIGLCGFFLQTSVLLCSYLSHSSQTNLQFNNNKYYLIQLLEDDAQRNFSVWMRWGRGNDIYYGFSELSFRKLEVIQWPEDSLRLNWWTGSSVT